jgi:hypothetical protein
MNRSICLAVAAFLALPAFAHSKETSRVFFVDFCKAPQAQVLGPDKGYVFPALKDIRTARFPMNMAAKMGEGFAKFEFTIEADGTTSGVTLIAAAGAKATIDSATDWMTKLRFEPGTFQGRPIPFYGNQHSAAFVQDFDKPQIAVNRWVEANYTDSIALIQANKTGEAIELLERTLVRGETLSRVTLYEQSMLSLALALAYLRQERLPEALQFVRRATVSDMQYLEPALGHAAWRLRTFLELMDGNLGFLNCQPPVPATLASDQTFVTDEAYNALTGKVQAALDSPAPLTVQGRLRANPVRAGDAEWVHPMVRRKFAFDSVNPSVKAFTLTCQTQIVTGAVNATQEWSIPNSAGRCSIRVTGDPGATFQFVEAH